jgi:ATP/maltotriose-dependent transcriptional regulator MalT
MTDTNPTLIHPAQPIIGRDHELAHLSALLHDPACRLLSLVGPGGIGKTRLALELVARQAQHFEDGTWFVPLQDILRLIAAGQSNREIAETLVMSVSTVKWYTSQIYSKLDVRNRTQAVLRVQELHLLD